jgi:hypothetical protein
MPQFSGTIAITSLVVLGAYAIKKAFEKWIAYEERRQFENRSERLKETYPTYSYEPLGDAESKNIRLIELLPREYLEEDNGPIIRIKTTALKDENGIEPYEALSYCWGDATTSVPILSDDGTIFLVSHNLYGALHRLSEDLTSPRTLWVDALCIYTS